MYFSLTGPTGTGKIKIVIRVGFTLNRMDLLGRGKTHLVTREDLVLKNSPQSSHFRCGFLVSYFFNESYYLNKVGNKQDFYHEVIEILLQNMENRLSLIIKNKVIVGLLKKLNYRF